MEEPEETPETAVEHQVATSRTWRGIKQKPIPKNAPADAWTIAQLHAYLEDLMTKGYAVYPVMWSAEGVFGYVRSVDSSCEDRGEYHRGVTVQDR